MVIGIRTVVIGGMALCLGAMAVLASSPSLHDDRSDPGRGVDAVPALSVTAVHPRREAMPVRVEATGTIAAWQDASVGTQADGLRLAEVLVDVGDAVKRGDVMAVFAPETVLAELAEAEAAVALAQASLTEAEANARRARRLEDTGAMARQQIEQVLTLEGTARARVGAAEAARERQRLRLAQARVRAPDDGIVSSRTATVGAVLPAGEELFRMIRGGRLEWRAEMSAADMAAIAPGRLARIDMEGGGTVDGRVRAVAPTVDASTLKGIVYVDIPAGRARAGQFARGTLELGAVDASTLPQGALVLRDGTSHVLRIGADSRVDLLAITPGRRAGDRVEILGGLAAEDRVVASGGGFLGDGDLVRVVETVRAGPPIDATTPAIPVVD